MIKCAYEQDSFWVSFSFAKKLFFQKNDPLNANAQLMFKELRHDIFCKVKFQVKEASVELKFMLSLSLISRPMYYNSSWVASVWSPLFLDCNRKNLIQNNRNTSFAYLRLKRIHFFFEKFESLPPLHTLISFRQSLYRPCAQPIQCSNGSY